MKRKISYLIFVLMILLPFKVYGLTGEVTLSCSPATVAPGGSSTCSIKAKNVDKNVADFKMKYSVDNDSVTFDAAGYAAAAGLYEFSDMSSINGEIYGVTKCNEETLTCALDGKSDFDIGTFTVNVAATATGGKAVISLTEIDFTDSDYSGNGRLADVTASITISDSTPPVKSGLSKLSVTNGALNKVFSTDDFNYTVTLDNDATSFTINATPVNSSDTVVLYNDSVSESNKISSNTIEFKPADGKNAMTVLAVVGGKTYTLVIGKKPSDVSGLLSALSVNGVAVNLDACISMDTAGVSCSVTIPSSPKSYTFSATLKDSDKYKLDTSINNGSTTYPNGDNNFVVRVIPKDSTSGLSSMTYNIVVNRSSAGSNTSSGDKIPSNPQTGTASFIVILSMLLLSILASVMIYKRRIIPTENTK